MKKLYITVIVLLFAACTAASAAVLSWDIRKNDRLEITRTATVKFLVNDRLNRVYQERNIIDLTCHERTAASSAVKGRFSVYARSTAKEVFHLREQYPSEFEIDRQGRFTVPKQYFMPNMRNLPVFPEKDAGKGDTWTAPAELVLDTFSTPFKLTFPVEYRVMEIVNKDGSENAVIGYRFTIDYDLSGGKYPADFPVKILGKDEGIITWDVRNSRPLNMKEKYRILFFFPSGKKEPDAREFQMIIETEMKTYRPVTREEKEKAKRELKKEVPDGVDVDTESRGLVMRLGDVLFDFDSAGLRRDSREKLDRVSEIIRSRYPDREIIVEGHTDNVGGAGYNMRLSRDRAESVAAYLKKRAGTDKLSYRGLGADDPIADNGTKEGRQKNRRVEIIIKLE